MIHLTEKEKEALDYLFFDRLTKEALYDKYKDRLNNLLQRGILYLDGFGHYKVNQELYQDFLYST